MKQLRELTSSARDVFTRILGASDISETTGACMYGCILLASMLERFHNDAEVQIRGGGPPSFMNNHDFSGYKDKHGKFMGHYWLEVTVPEGIFVVDITADQFDDDPVVIVPIKESIDRYVPGSQVYVDKHAEEVKRFELGQK